MLHGSKEDSMLVKRIAGVEKVKKPMVFKIEILFCFCFWFLWFFYGFIVFRF